LRVGCGGSDQPPPVKLPWDIGTWVRKIRFRIRQGIPPSVRNLAHKPRQTNEPPFLARPFSCLPEIDDLVCPFGWRLSKRAAGGITHPTEG